MTNKPLPEDKPEYLRELERCARERQAAADVIVRNLKFERAEREFQQEEFRKAKLRALRTLARTDPLAREIAQKIHDRARMKMLGYKKD
jgi:hypothetical protein